MRIVQKYRSNAWELCKNTAVMHNMIIVQKCVYLKTMNIPFFFLFQGNLNDPF